MVRTFRERGPRREPGARLIASLVAVAVAGCAPVLERTVELEPAGEARPVRGASPSPSRDRQAVLDVTASLTGSRVEVAAVRYDECALEREAPFVVTEPRRGRIPLETGADGRAVVDLAQLPLPAESLGPGEEFQVWRIGTGGGPHGSVRVAAIPASAVAEALERDPARPSAPDDDALAAVARAWVTATDGAFGQGLRALDAPRFRALPAAVRAGAHARVELRQVRDEISRIDGECRQHEGREVARLESEAQDLLVRAHRAATDSDREALVLLATQVGARNRPRIEEIEFRAHGRDGLAARRREREAVVRRGAAWLRAVAASGDPRLYAELMLSLCTARMPIGLDEESTVRWTLFSRDPVCDLAREATTKLPPPRDLAARLDLLPPS